MPCQGCSEAAQPGTDFYHGVGIGYLACFKNERKHIGIRKEVLPQLLFGTGTVYRKEVAHLLLECHIFINASVGALFKRAHGTRADHLLGRRGFKPRLRGLLGSARFETAPTETKMLL